MSIQPSWQSRQKSQKAERKQQVTREALRVFLADGIEPSTMNDVARQSGIGVASVYRYFTTKQELVIESAKLFWQENILQIYTRHERQTDSLKSGLDRVSNLLGIYLELFDHAQDFFRFLEQFDLFVQREKIEPAMLASYDESLLDIRHLFEQALASGIRDGSIRPDIELAVFCSTVPQAILAFAQKLVSRGQITPSDQQQDARRELELLIDMIRAYLIHR